MKAVLNERDAQVIEGLTRDQLLACFRCMLLSRKLDDKEIQLKGQSRIFPDQRRRPQGARPGAGAG
jgi:TPP-dependent pyruvate/acetoin dehydrogenase alpha subunit